METIIAKDNAREQLYASLEALSQPQEKKQTTWKLRLIKILIVALVLVLCAELAFYLIIIPCTAPIQVHFEGMTTISTDKLYEIAHLTGSETWISYDSATVAAQFASNPLFESVSVKKKFPDQVIITVEERTSVAMALTVLNGKTVPVQIDSHGVVFRVNEGLPKNNSVPLITGLTFENPYAGMRLHSQLIPLMEQLAVLQKNASAYLSLLSEIKIVPKSYGNYDLVLYPEYSQVRVITDKVLNEESLRYMVIVLDVIDSFAKDVAEIDLRYGSVSYRMKGEHS